MTLYTQKKYVWTYPLKKLAMYIMYIYMMNFLENHSMEQVLTYYKQLSLCLRICKPSYDTVWWEHFGLPDNPIPKWPIPHNYTPHRTLQNDSLREYTSGVFQNNFNTPEVM